MAEKRRKPLIAVTGPDRGGFTAWFFTAWQIRRAGGRPHRITPRRRNKPVDFDGLVIGGGIDIDPKWYNRDQPAPELVPDLKGREHGWRGILRYLFQAVFFPLVFVLRKLFRPGKPSATDPQRDQLEFFLLELAFKDQLPVLGICRGAQLINVFRNGTLHRDISGFYVETAQIRSILPKKKILLEPDCTLHRLLEIDSCYVNALHSQAIDRPGEGVRISAREPNGVVQAIELAAYPFVIGVQWHPEFLPQIGRQRSLFEALVSHC